MTVQVITDSTSDIPPELAAELNIGIVPIYVHFGDKTYRDGRDLKGDEFYSLLTTSPVHPSTSQPNPNDFATVYKEYSRKADGIVSIHISSRISGTYNSAVLACELVEDCPVEVIDSRFNSAGLGLVVTAAARLARKDASMTEVVREANNAIRQVNMFGMFSTMKYLVRSGRVNKTIATASDFLHVIPLLTFHDGEIVRAGLVRSIARGMDRIYNFVKSNLPVSELTIVHSAIKDQALELKNRLSEYMPEGSISIAQLGASLGVHGGPGVLLGAIRKAS